LFAARVVKIVKVACPPAVKPGWILALLQLSPAPIASPAGRFGGLAERASGNLKLPGWNPSFVFRELLFGSAGILQ
jgi:hypothetical protein